MPEFLHLHCHTQYSLLDGASDIGFMMDKALADGQKGVALTDHGNMYGAFKFVAEANKRGLKPIVGCEFYLVEDRHKKSFSKIKGEKDKRFHQLLLAKDQAGYENLSKLCSLGFIQGMYSKFPRIDKELLLEYKDGLVATSCCIGAEIPQAIMCGDLEKADELVRWWFDLFGEDFYIELQRHRGLENIDGLGISQEDINQELIKFARKYGIKVIATNDSHYIEEEDYKWHDILLCVNTGSKLNDEGRFNFPSSDFYFKTQAEMNMLFNDIPEAIDNTMEIFDKIQAPKLKRDILLPNFPLPTGFKNQPDYLRHLVYEGAKIRYGEMTQAVTERLDLELKIIKDMGFDGYFLIVQDFIKAARDMGVSVGPGRGSAAGSAVAYCLTITNIDPIHYNLLFERFLNPERVSMPDIDIDFDDYGRQQVIDWVIDKYGKTQVAQIITFGTMAAKSSIRDVARVSDLPLPQADRIAKLVPTKPGTKLRKIFGKSIKQLNSDWQADELAAIGQLHDIEKKDDLEGETVRMAQKVEGAVRNTGIHAAGVIIAPDDITKFIPVCTSKDTDLFVTQFDGSVVEDAGMLKMDFLGLKTLSIIKDAIENIVDRHGEEQRIDPDEIPLDDTKTFELFQRGDMVGIFQFESEGMRKHLRELKPTSIEDLIAMNALYRPGPMQYIPNFVDRKHGREKVVYPHEWLEGILKPTYGIMVYQEQIMQTAQIMADYSLGQADMLRRAMGKKKLKEMEKHRKIFKEGAGKKGVTEENAMQIFDDMEKFASYGFNRSHAAAYSVVAFQTAYLKTHFPAEYMASVLTHNKTQITNLNFFLRECKRMNLEVLVPNVNESNLNFAVNKKGQIVFGLSALKGVGEGPVEALMKERAEKPFISVFDMMRRLDLRSVNKKSMESLVLGGGLDLFPDFARSQYFAPSGKYDTFLEHLLKYGNAYQAQKAQSVNSLFGDSEEAMIQEPDVPQVKPWTLIEKLTKEKDVTGIYISGHPLDDYRVEVENYTTCTLDRINDFKGQNINIAGIVTMAQHRISKKGTGWGLFTLQDYNDSLEFALFTEDYLNFSPLLQPGEVLYIKGKYQKRWNSDEYQLKLLEVRQLDSVGKELTKSITLKMDIAHLDAKLINGLEKLCKTYKGKHKLKLELLDKKNKIRLHTYSSNQKVNADVEFVQGIEALGLSYKVNV